MLLISDFSTKDGNITETKLILDTFELKYIAARTTKNIFVDINVKLQNYSMGVLIILYTDLIRLDLNFL